MAVLHVDALTTSLCDDCPGMRVIATEQHTPDALLVTILAGCTRCEGQSLTVCR